MSDDYSEFAAESGDVDPQFDEVPAQEGTFPEATGEVTFEQAYRVAYTGWANAVKRLADPEHEAVENPDLIEISKSEALDLLYRIGQPDPELTFQLTDELYNCNSLYDAICDYGIDTKARTEQFGTLLSVLSLVQSVTSAFLTPAARGKKTDLTRIKLGQVQGKGKSSITTDLSTTLNAGDGQFFASNPQAFFITEATLELTNATAKQWCKDIISHTTNVLSLTSRQFLGSSLRVEFVDPSPTHLTIKFIGSDVDAVAKANLTFILTQLTNMLFPEGFMTEWKWGVSFEEILEIPLVELLNSEISLSLPALGISSQQLGLIPSLVPLELFNVASFDELCDKVPGLRDIVNGNLATTLDLRDFVGGIIAKFLNKSEDASNTDTLQTTTLLSLIGDWAPVAFTFVSPFLSNNLTLTDLVSALRSLIALARLIFARDFSNFTAFRTACQSGHSFSFVSDNVFKVDSIFRALDTVLAKLSEIAVNMPAVEPITGGLENIK